MSNYIFVDVEARGTSPVNGTMTEFGAVHEKSLETFHGVLFQGTPDPANPAVPIVGERLADDEDVAFEFSLWLKKVGGNERPVFVSDNVAYDWQWISGMYDKAVLPNPFGHSGRRISDFYAGLMNNWGDTQKWKRFRRTPHTHNPVDDAMGNVEAFQVLKEIATDLRKQPTLEDLRKQVASEIFSLAHELAVDDNTMVGSESLRDYHYYNAIAKIGKFDGR